MGGFGASGAHNTLILINGRRQNDVDLSGANLAAIPLESIARIEIIHGSSAVLYGDNAVSGLINIVTRSGFEQQRSTLTASTGSFNTHTLNLDFSNSFGDTAVYIDAKKQQSDGYRDASQFQQKNLVTELSRNSNDLNYGLRFNHFNEDLQLPGALETVAYQADPTQASNSSDNAQQRRSGIDLFLSGELLNAELTYSDKHQEAFGTTEADLTTLSFTPRLRHNMAEHQLTAGVDVYNSQLDTHADYGVAGNVSDTTRSSYAFYLNDTFTLTPQSHLNIGLRQQQTKLELNNNDLYSSASDKKKRDDTVNAWDLSVKHHFNDKLAVHARIAKSFRLAVLDEMWSYFSGTINPLKPQTAHHVETGADYQLSARADIKINLFGISLNDEIGYNVNTSSNENLDPTRHQGADFNYHRSITDTWELNLGYAYRYATFRAGNNKDNQLPEIPNHRATLANHIVLDNNNSMTADIIYTGKRFFGDDYANTGNRMPGHTRANLGYQYQHNFWKVQLRIDNVTDNKAADHGYYADWTTPASYYYYPLPGRTYYLTIGADF
jgi:iron complex outermembrane receptor protein